MWPAASSSSGEAAATAASNARRRRRCRGARRSRGTFAVEGRPGIDQREVDVEEDRRASCVGARPRSGGRPAIATPRARDRAALRGGGTFTSSSVTRVEQVGSRAIEVEPEAEELGVVQERSRCWRWSRACAASSRSGSARVRQLPLGRPVARHPSRPRRRSPRRVRSTFCGLDARADHQRPGPRWRRTS